MDERLDLIEKSANSAADGLGIGLREANDKVSNIYIF